MTLFLVTASTSPLRSVLSSTAKSRSLLNAFPSLLSLSTYTSLLFWVLIDSWCSSYRPFSCLMNVIYEMFMLSCISMHIRVERAVATLCLLFSRLRLLCLRKREVDKRNKRTPRCELEHIALLSLVLEFYHFYLAQTIVQLEFISSCSTTSSSSNNTRVDSSFQHVDIVYATLSLRLEPWLLP